jgi:subtilase family serine protease
VARAVLIALASVLVCAAAGLAASPRPDLGVVKLVVPDEATAGGKLTIRDRTGNAGKATAKGSQTAYYLSIDARKSANDIALGHRSVGRLKPGKTSAGSATVTVPNASGLFRVIACADDKGRIRESREANNCRAAPRDIRINQAP